MVIVECAAHGVPSIIHRQDIGAQELLENAVLNTDMNDASTAAEDVRAILQDCKLMETLGTSAKAISLQYNSDAFRKRLEEIIIQ